MILIKEVTAEELASLWHQCEKTLSEKFPMFTTVDIATLVLRHLQIKADVEPRTLSSEAPSS